MCSQLGVTKSRVVETGTADLTLDSSTKWDLEGANQEMMITDSHLSTSIDSTVDPHVREERERRAAGQNEVNDQAFGIR